MENMLKLVFDLDDYPCSEACDWAQKRTFIVKTELVLAAKTEWRQWVAIHSRDADTLLALAADQHWNVRRAVAQNANTPAD